MENKGLKEGQTFWIRAEETVVKAIALVIGKGITLEDAIELQKLLDESDEFMEYDNGYDLLQGLIGDDSYIYDSFGYENVSYDIEENGNN